MLNGGLTKAMARGSYYTYIQQRRNQQRYRMYIAKQEWAKKWRRLQYIRNVRIQRIWAQSWRKYKYPTY